MTKQDFIAGWPSNGSLDQAHALELRLIASVALGCKESRKRAREPESLTTEIAFTGLPPAAELLIGLRLRGGAAYAKCKKSGST